jgi:uncharacterized protein (TIGR04141 family)
MKKGATDKTYSLGIYLLKPGLVEAQYLRAPHAAHKHSVKFSESLAGDLFLLPAKDSQPKWLSLFSTAVTDLPTIITRNASALLIVSIGNATFALSFGYGRKLLSPGSWEEDFGLKVTLNSVDKQKIRSVDRISFDAIGQHGRIQASREADISEFGLDLEQDMIRAVTGKPGDETLGKRLTGKDALHVTLPLTITGLPQLLEKYLEQYKKDTYKKEFPWIDQISEVKDPSLITNLNSMLINRIQNQDFNRLWLSIPELVDWTVVEGFKYKTSDVAPIHDDVHMKDFIDEVKPRSGNFTLDFFKRNEIYAVLPDGTINDDWSVFRCIYCELDHQNETFLLTSGRWYRVGADFLNRINDFYSTIPTPGFTLPNYKDKSEPVYTARVASELLQDFALMDQKFILCDPPYGKAEFCDLYRAGKKIIHVKRYTGAAAPLSHLFSQAIVSGILFRKDPDFRTGANDLLPATFRPITAAPAQKEYEIVLGIVSASKNPLVLPLFSRVNLKNTMERLTDLGYAVSMLKIQA